MTPHRTRVHPALVLAAALGLSGWTLASCAGRVPAPAAVACEPVTGELAAGARAATLNGEFRLSLTASSGPRTGRSTTGTLRLFPFGTRPVPVPLAPGTAYPLFGGARLTLEEVGALSPGDITGEDPSAPGVLAIEWRRADAPAGRNEITLRLGTDANHGDRLRFDGAFMALNVTSIAPDRFAGRWRSGGGDQQAEGYFCAERVAPAS